MGQDILQSRFEMGTSHWKLVFEKNKKYLQYKYLETIQLLMMSKRWRFRYDVYREEIKEKSEKRRVKQMSCK